MRDIRPDRETHEIYAKDKDVQERYNSRQSKTLEKHDKIEQLTRETQPDGATHERNMTRQSNTLEKHDQIE